MEFISTQKYIKVSPSKIRPVVFMLKGLSPVRAVETLPYVRKRGADYLQKVIKTAIAQAKEKGISDTDLLVKEIQITEGPRLKRGIPVSRGRWHPILKRMCHIRVVLSVKEGKDKKVEEKKAEDSIKKEEKKEVKKIVRTRKVK